STALGEPAVAASVLADRLIRSLGMPRSLTAVGLKDSDLDALAGFTFQDIWCGTNPRPVPDSSALIDLLRRAL
ncbi:MAG: iron-containing alcohol dehydrogenase, partial [Betaproteobacteria bacterium]